MSKSNTFENDILKLILNNVSITDIGDSAGLLQSTTAGSLWLSLHTADPGETGTAITSETAYTNYARVEVPRSSAGFTISGSSATLTANADFPKCGATAGSDITYFGVVNTASGAGKLLYSGQLAIAIPMVANLTIPRLTTETSITED